MVAKKIGHPKCHACIYFSDAWSQNHSQTPITFWRSPRAIAFLVFPNHILWASSTLYFRSAAHNCSDRSRFQGCSKVVTNILYDYMVYMILLLNKIFWQLKTNDDYYTIDSFRTCIAACMRVSNCVKQEKCGILQKNMYCTYLSNTS